jgi:hypothetical protein
MRSVLTDQTFYGQLIATLTLDLVVPAANADLNIKVDTAAYAGRVSFYSGAVKVFHLGKTTGNGFNIKSFDTTTGAIIGDVMNVAANTNAPVFPGAASVSMPAQTSYFTVDADSLFAGLYRWTRGGLNRYQMQMGANAESGSNAGSPFNFNAYNDAGTLLGNIWSVVRSTQVQTFGQIPAHPTAADGDNTTQSATTAYAVKAAPNASYRNILDCSASHTAARVAGTYWLGQGDPAGITGVGTLYPPNVLYIDPGDYPSVNGLTTKLRLRIGLAVNDVAPTGNYTFGLYPVTRPATSGAAGLCTYTMGTVVAGSTVAINTPAADSNNNVVSADFAIPAAGFYVMGFVSSAAVAASSHIHIGAVLQQRNT